MQDEMKKNREEWLDVLKGLAIILVVLGHGPIFNEDLFDFIWAFHMPLFFLISGYTFHKKNSKEFFSNKWKRLMLPYFFTCVLLLFVALIQSIKNNGLIWLNIRDVIIRWVWAGIYGSCWSYDTPFKIYDIGAIWFLCTLFCASILFNYVVMLNSEHQLWLVAILVYLGINTKSFIWLPWNLQSAMVAVVFMYIGYMTKMYGWLNNNNENSHCVPIIILGIISMIGIHNHSMVIMGNNSYTFGVLSLIIAISISYFKTIISKFIVRYLKNISRFLSFLGKNTLIILCFHLIELDFIPWINYAIGITKNSVLQYICIYIMKMIWALIAILLVHKIKFLRQIYVGSAK